MEFLRLRFFRGFTKKGSTLVGNLFINRSFIGRARFFVEANPGTEDGADFTAALNRNSLETITAQVEPGLAAAAPGSRYQFERQGYFCADGVDAKPGKPVFNRIVSLRDSWAKIEKAGET